MPGEVERDVMKFTPRSLTGFAVLALIQVVALILILPFVNLTYKTAKKWAMRLVPTGAAVPGS